ncbi:bifunctional lysine-specific demethylase and histidyl-hydroxylase NO66-like [Drosophila willistoni]|uniref:bifunctional lysine-specific demethylase and histidyl-hydroxylase NO66-like n=1 Tax=Drosophila willistoni TaxID=7260 RepID=UPI00017D8B56|nr:bifunctional lysine-specific demethylase and histidyl-hydroxylase NO66-like [Drosophila willistoni]
MLITSTIFAPLWYPLRYQWGLLRSLSSGMQVPGTNLVLVPSTGRSRFKGYWILAIAGAWLVIRLVSSDFKEAMGEMLTDIIDRQISYKEVKNEQEKIRTKLHHHHHEKEDQEDQQNVTTTIHEEEEVSSSSVENYSSTYNDDSGEEKVFYWRRLPGGRKPTFSFTAKELDFLLQLPLSVDCNDSQISDSDEEVEEEDEEHGDEEESVSSESTESTETDTENEDDHQYIETSTPLQLSQEQDSETESYDGDQYQDYDFSSQETEDDAGST